jgi:predicted nucleotidyltransferase
VLDLEPRHLEEVRRILREHVPHCEVRAFGSRIKGGAKPYADLDLVVMTATPLPMRSKVALEAALSESRLPFKVDLLYWDELSEGFRQRIDQGWEPVQAAEPLRPLAER